LWSPDAFSRRRLELSDVAHFDMLAAAFDEACPIGFDPVLFHEPIHEVEQAANRDGGVNAASSHPAAKTASASV